MERYNPLNDFVFKKIFGSNENKDLLISLLNAILDPSDREKLIDLEVLDENLLTKETIYEKTGRLDVKAKTKCGMLCSLDNRIKDQKDFERRTLFYWGKMYINSIKSGQRYNELEKVITINILDFNYLDINLFHSQFHLWEDHQKKFLLTDLIEIHFIEMPKFKRVIKKDILNNSLQRWLKFLDKSILEDELEELIEMDKSIKKAEKKLEYLSQDPEARKLYEARENARIEYNSDIGLATEKGRQKGLEEGEVKGRKEGLEEGKRTLVINALKKGLDIETIAAITGLSKEEILEIKNSL